MKRLVAALIGGVVIFGAAYALAASLSVSSDTLGAGNQTVSACSGTNIPLQYTSDVTWYAAGGYYGVNSVDFSSGIPVACEGMKARVTLSAAGGASLCELNGTLPANTSAFDTSSATPAWTVATCSTPANASNVVAANVVISSH